MRTEKSFWRVTALKCLEVEVWKEKKRREKEERTSKRQRVRVERRCFDREQTFFPSFLSLSLALPVSALLVSRSISITGDTTQPQHSPPERVVAPAAQLPEAHAAEQRRDGQRPVEQERRREQEGRQVEQRVGARPAPLGVSLARRRSR